MNARKITFTVLAITLIAIPALVLAQAGPGGGRGSCGDDEGGFFGPRAGRGGFGGGGMLLGRLGDRLELTDEQRSQIEAILQASREQAEPLREQMAEERDAFRESREPGVFDEAAARAHAESQSTLRTELMVLRMKTKSDVFNVLTPEQQQDFLELRELFGDGHGRRGGGGGKRFGGGAR